MMRDSNSREDKSGIFFQKANRNKTGLMGAPGICTATVGGTKHLLTGQGGFYSREKGISEAYNVICLFSIVRPKDSHDASKRCLVKQLCFALLSTLPVPKQLILHIAGIYSCIGALPILEFCCTLPQRVRGKHFPLWLWLCHSKDKHKSKVD